MGVLAIGCKEKPKSIDKFDPNAAVSVDISIISNQSVPKLIEVNGSVISSDFVELRPEINGRVTFLQIPEGKVVSAGTVLVKLNDADLQAQLEKIVIDGFKVPMGQKESVDKVVDSKKITLFDIAHSEKLVLVDDKGQIRGYYGTSRVEMDKMMIDLGLLVNNSFSKAQPVAVPATTSLKEKEI